MQRRSHDPLRDQVLSARDRTLSWLETQRLPAFAPGAYRFSPAHDVTKWPGMILPGTYNGIQCQALLSALDRLDEHDRKLTADWIETHRQTDGVFRLPGMTGDGVFKKADPEETWNYIDFHVTNYSLGAIEFLDSDRPPILTFAHPWLDPDFLTGWLAARDWSDPWLEGNNLVNLASFLFLMKKNGDAEKAALAGAAIDRMMRDLEAIQNPSTGFWGDDQDNGGLALLNAMAGAMHAFHIWYAVERPLPHQNEAMDFTLSLDPNIVMGACLDVDAVDLLLNGTRMSGYRHEETRDWMTKKLAALLSFQSDDGGFADTTDGTLRFDGWVRGYAEDQGQSNTFATWFRWIAIAMISDLLWPDWRDWTYRKMIGIGYCRTGTAAP